MERSGVCKWYGALLPTVWVVSSALLRLI
jgi:hypothetical protein